MARKLILTKSGVYASPENLQMVDIRLAEDAYSSKYVGTVSCTVVGCLNINFSGVML